MVKTKQVLKKEEKLDNKSLVVNKSNNKDIKKVKSNIIKEVKAETEKTKNIAKKDLTFKQKKELWNSNAVVSSECQTCCKCHKKKVKKYIDYNEHNYCYKCWIKSSKKHKSNSKKNRKIKEVIKEDYLDPKIYVVGNRWENIK